MKVHELFAAMSQCSLGLCIGCLATITAPLERDELLELLAGDVEARVDTCAACKRDTRMTYRFQRVDSMADDVVASVHSLCIDCVAALEALEALVQRDVEKTVGLCRGCHHAGRVTYTFHIGPLTLAA
jgi:hypothetical protein